MTALRPARRSAGLLAVATLASLVACTDDAVSPETANTPAERPAAEFRRLLVSDTLPFARLFDANGTRVDSMGGLPGRVTYLYSAGGRIAAAHFQRQNRVAFIDGGVFEQNGRGVRQPARLLGGHSDSVPIHGNYMDGIKSVHFDGTGTVSFFRETEIVGGRMTPLLSVRAGSPHHGAGIALPGGQFVSASANINNEQLPIGVKVFDLTGRVVDSARTCPGLHGLSGNVTGALYGCADGALHVAITNGRPVFTKLTNTADARFGVGTVWTAPSQRNFLVRMSIRGQPVSAATRAIGLGDVATRSLRAIPLPGGDIDWTAAVEYSGRVAFILGRSGSLYVADMTSGQIVTTLANATPPFPTAGTVLTPFFASVEGVTYVTNPTRGEVIEINTSGAVPQIARRLSVGGTPERIEVMGVRAAKSLPAN